MALPGGGVSLREFTSVPEELLYLREQVDALSSNEFNLVSVIDDHHRRERERWAQETSELKRQNDNLLRENEAAKKTQAQMNRENEVLKGKEAHMTQRYEQAAGRLREERTLNKQAREANDESCRRLSDFELRLGTKEKELAYIKLALRHEMEDHKSTYSALYQHLRSCPEASKTVESVEKMRATKEKLREYVLSTGYLYSSSAEDVWDRLDEACDPIHDRSHDHDDHEDFFMGRFGSMRLGWKGLVSCQF
jgi:chromosome segregation ATPase